MAVVKNRALGDTIISLGTLEFLKSILPDTEIFYLVPEWTGPLFKNVNFFPAKIVPFKMHSPGDWISTFRLLRKLKVDAILELSQAGRTGMFFDLYSSVFRVPYFFHNHHSKSGPVRDQGVQKAIIQRDLDAAWTFFGWLQRVPVPNYLEYAPRLALPEVPKVKRVILGVVATREAKMYPLEKYAEIARLIRAHDMEIEIVAPLSNSPDDKIIADKIAALKSPIQTVIKPLEQLPLYFKESMIYIGNDTGLKHLAVAMDIPTVTLFGPEPPIEWHPYDKKAHPYFFRHPLPCRYTTGKTYCPLSKCSSMICLSEIPPEGIWEKAKQLLYQTEDMGSTGSYQNTGSISMPNNLDLGVQPQKSSAQPIELERTHIMPASRNEDDSVDFGQVSMVSENNKGSSDDPDDDDEKTNVL